MASREKHSLSQWSGDRGKQAYVDSHDVETSYRIVDEETPRPEKGSGSVERDVSWRRIDESP
jgi:hypothetical protein